MRAITRTAVGAAAALTLSLTLGACGEDDQPAPSSPTSTTEQMGDDSQMTGDMTGDMGDDVGDDGSMTSDMSEDMGNGGMGDQDMSTAP